MEWEALEIDSFKTFVDNISNILHGFPYALLKSSKGQVEKLAFRRRRQFNHFNTGEDRGFVWSSLSALPLPSRTFRH